VLVRDRLTHHERAIGSRRGGGSSAGADNELVQRRNRVNLVERMPQPQLQIVSLAQRLRSVLALDQQLFGVGGEGKQRRVHRYRGSEQGREQRDEPGGLRRTTQAMADTGEQDGAGAGARERHPERQDRGCRARQRRYDRGERRAGDPRAHADQSQ
jgi:hypothetical protein